MEIDLKRQLLDYLMGFISENKQSKFKEIIMFRTRYITVVLEDIFQPHNASAVLRSCDCFGVQDVHIIENKNTYKVNEDVALGSSKWLSLIRYNKTNENTLEAYQKLRDKGYKIIAACPHERGCLIENLSLDNKIALVFGTELEGLSSQAIHGADGHIKIPMYGFTESFNLSVSVALSLFHLTEKLRKSDIDWKLTNHEMIDVQLNWARNVIKKADVIEKDFLKPII